MVITLLIASQGPLTGGMEKQVALQANHMAKRSESEITVLAAPCYQAIFSKDVKFIPLDLHLSRRNPRLLISLAHIIRTVSPDILHAHGHKAAALASKIRRVIPSKTKLVGTAHGLKRNNNALRKMDEIFVVSHGIQKNILPLKSTIVHNGIEAPKKHTMTRASFCQSLGLIEQFPIILAVGRLVKLKRYDHLIRSAEGLAANIVIVGDGPESNNLKKISGGNVTFTGFRKDIRSIYDIADLLVICSEREGLSLTLIEALQSELPVISTRVPGSSDLLPELCLFDSTKKKDLHALIERHLLNLQDLQSCLEDTFSYARNQLLIERVAQRTFELYSKTLDVHML